MKMVWCTFQLVGFHAYPNPPKEVAYLQHTHRHVFHFKVGVEVHTDNREIEFITMKKWLVNHLNSHQSDEMEWKNFSCEMICEEILNLLAMNEPYAHFFPKHAGDINIKPRCHYVEVSEDGENGATYTNY